MTDTNKVEPVALTADERKALERFQETTDDGEGYDVPKQMMRRLAQIGVVHHTSGGIYGITDFGHFVLGNTHSASALAALRQENEEAKTSAYQRGYMDGAAKKYADLEAESQRLSAHATEIRSQRDTLRTQLAEAQAKVRELVGVLRKCQPYVEQALDVVGGMDEYHAESGLHTAIAKYGEQK